jgi:RNA recognition motif-containing protein
MRIYVGNLPREVGEQELRGAFEAYGQVGSVWVITDLHTGLCRGFGFVEMPVRPEAEAAMRGLNGSRLKQRILRVSEARPRSGRR